MSTLNHPVTGHEVRTDSESADFWKAAGYRDADEKKPARKAASKKTAPKSDK